CSDSSGRSGRSLPVRDPALESECAIEQLDVSESGLAEQISVLLRREHGQPPLERQDVFSLRRRHSGGDRESSVTLEPLVLVRAFGGEAVMYDDQRSASLEPRMHLLQRLQACGPRKKVQRQKAGRAVERSHGSRVD